MSRYYSRRYPRSIPQNETPEQKRVREDREEIANVRIRSQVNRTLSSHKKAVQEDWDLCRATAGAKVAA